jgi:iron complex outermembrane receptor protein
VTSPLARAQSVDENAVTDSEDAFGRSVGNQTTGLYSSREVRGFSPVDAGNVRLDSLYFDQVNNPSYRMLDGTTIRVGLSTMGYSFPAPSGLVDYALTDYGVSPAVSLDVNGEHDKPFPNLAAEVRIPIAGEDLGIYAGGAMLFQRSGDGREHRMDTYGSVLTWRPLPSGEVSVFAWHSNPRGEEARPTFFVAGSDLPPEIERNKDLSQPWADSRRDNLLLGGVAHLPLGNGFRIDAGLFSDRSAERSRFADLLNAVAPHGFVGERVIVADRGGRDHSLSGEVRLVRTFTTGDLDHRVTASLRGRARDRLFGGAQRISLGASTILVRDERNPVEFTPGPKNSDQVRQIFYGAAYAGDYFDRLIVDASISGTRYTKEVDFADPTVADVEINDSPALWNVSAAYDVAPGLSVFAGISRGMEDALVAPDRAVNRAEAPPSIDTRQREAGVRYSAGEWFTGVVGLFRISKPYYNLDPTLRYRLLGTIVNRGLEVSLVSSPLPGLTLLGGALLSDPQIVGEAVESGLVGSTPIGQGDTRIVANVDWRPASGESPLSLDLALERTEGRFGNSQNTLRLPPATVVDLGLRYRFNLGPAAMLFRARVQNLFNNYAWNVSSSGGLTYTDPRRLELQMVADF